MSQIDKKLLFLMLICFFLSLNAWAQDEDMQESVQSEDTEYDSVITKYDTENSSLVRIKKNYKLGDGVTFITKNGSFNITQSLQTLYNMQTPDEFDSFSSQFRIRRARMKMSGNAFDNKLYYRFRLNFASNYQSATSGARSYNPVLQDAYIEYRPTPNQRINFGLRADYIDTREIRFEGEVLGFVERSAVPDAFDAIFDYGIRYTGTFRVFNKQLIKPYASITTGEGNAALQQNYRGFKYGVRLDYLPFGEFTKSGEFYMEDMIREPKPKLVFGGIYSYADGASSAKGTNGGRYIYGGTTENILLPDYIKYGVDYLFKYRGFYSLGSFVKTKATVPSGIAGEFNLSGVFVPYKNETPEQIQNKVLSRLNLGYGYNIQAGYLLPSDISFGLRYSHLYQDQQSASFAALNNFYSIVATKYFSGKSFKLQGELGYQEYAEPTLLANGSYLAQIMLTIVL
ncbi:hypothetical protein [Flavobacterium sp. IMCC34518]|uniref:hypothetical protein n=1 Tax=Flavobacterium sp. IMCC34518 TaxID=3003623 RepID=UPI0022ABFE5C|nr:hypothetical protein [Flavobacterium sp. IMCC34518]